MALPPLNLPKTMTIPGFDPNWDQIIRGDPTFIRRQLELDALRGTSKQNTLDALRQRLIGWGVIPGLEGLGQSSLLGEAVDPLTRQLAQQGTLSGVSEAARMDEANRTAHRQIGNQFGARGIFNSAGVAQGRQEAGYQRSKYDALQQVMDYLRQALGGHAGQLAEYAGAEQDAYEQAYQNQLGLPQNQPTADTELTKIPMARGYYRGSDGNLYNAQKQPIDVAAAWKHYGSKIAAMRRAGWSDQRIKNTWIWARYKALASVR